MSEHECIVCGNMHDPERAEQAERALAEKDRWQEKVCTKCGYIAVVHDTKEAFDTLRATLARVEGERDSLIRQLGIADREVKRRGEERDGLRAALDDAKTIIERNVSPIYSRHILARIAALGRPASGGS